jgi:hypothetical protein
MIEYTRDIRGVPLWLLREYLQELGGEVAAGGLITGDGWTASLTQLGDFWVGSLTVGQVRLDMQSTEEAWHSIQAALEKKLLRAGG